MKRAAFYLWAKTERDKGSGWHPLPLHVLDVAASADAILMREPEATRHCMAEILGMGWIEARPWLLLLIACHDLGKASPGFQIKWDGSKELLVHGGLRIPAGVDSSVNHAFVSQVAISAFLKKHGWPEELSDMVADAVGCHHGERISPHKLFLLSGNRTAMGDQGWDDARYSIFEALLEVLGPKEAPLKEDLSGPDFMLLAGLTSFADWIGSNEAFFPFGIPEDCSELNLWWEKRRKLAGKALDAVGWTPRLALISSVKNFAEVFQFYPRPLQQAVETVVQRVRAPCILLIEAPMGEGKTEAAFYAHLELQRRFEHRGLYVALPSKATGNAMFERTLKFLKEFAPKREVDLQLLHGAVLLNESFQKLRPSSVYNQDEEGSVRAHEWFTHKKRALLSEYGVGTVDQALLPILPVRHNFVRLWGLANRVIVFDEIHAYDAYTGTLLINLIQWLRALGSSVVLLSATLPPSFRRALAKIAHAKVPEEEARYPRLSIFTEGVFEQETFDADPSRRQTICLEAVSPDVNILRETILKKLESGGFGLVLVNTVQRAQDLYEVFSAGIPMTHNGIRVGKRTVDGTEIYLFHARFPADQRQQREEVVQAVFGNAGFRNGRKILIATQVAEQSLDLDFDVIASDLAPIDLVLQRAGRLWRHARSGRPVSEPILLVAGIDGDEPPSLEKPLWWGQVYREDLLLRTWILLRTRKSFILPDEIDTLVKMVYEDEIEIPQTMRERLDKASVIEDGESFAAKGQANHAHIGFPDDASWNDPARFVQADEDEPGLHRSLIAKTRLGEDSVVAIPIFAKDQYDAKKDPEFNLAKTWYLRAVSLSRKGVVKKLQSLGVPEGWKKSALLRNCYPMQFNPEGVWLEDEKVHLDESLGIVYVSKEAH